MSLIWGDCLEKMKMIAPNSIDLILTDPPYGTTQCKWDVVIPFVPMWQQIERVRKESAAVLLFGSEPFSSFLRCSNIKNFKYDWIYEKTEAKGHLNAKKQPLRAHEIISVFYKSSYSPIKTQDCKLKEAKNVNRASKQSELYGEQKTVTSYSSTERYPRSVIKFKTDKQKQNFHPTQKPVALLEYMIKTYTKENDTVLDFTMGSGSTGVACKKLNRKFIGIENNFEYFIISNERIFHTSIG